MPASIPIPAWAARLTLALAGLLALAFPTSASPMTAAPDTSVPLVPALVAPPLPPTAPTVCVLYEDQDPRAIHRLLDEQVAAWNRGDLEGYMRGYWKSDSLTFYSGGTISHGWQQAHDRYQKRYKSEGREMGALAFDVHDVTLIERGHVIVRGGWSLVMRDRRPAGLFTLWLRWFPETGWRIVHDHSSAAE